MNGTTGSLTSLRIEGHVATVTLERPDALNAISGALAVELTRSFHEVSTNKDVWVVVVAAAGDKAFCVGADLKERAGFSLEDFNANRRQIKDLFASVRAVPQPTVASVFGFALGGGCELALSCDLVVASDDVQLGLPEARVGLIPAGGGTQLLTRKLGPARAKELIFTGRRIGAHEAHALGLVTRVTSRDDLANATKALADDLCRSSPIAVRAAKRAIDGALGVPLSDGIEIEDGAWREVIGSSDRAEGIAAFNEKREAQWRNE